MINEIKRMLNSGIKFSLECIDPAGFELENFLNKEILKLDSIEPIKWQDGNFSLAEGLFIKPNDEYERRIYNQPFITSNELQYFKIKEPTFDDLIDVAVLAYKDGIADKLAIGFDGGIERVMLHIDGSAWSYYQSSDISGHIEHIDSLYNERFVIKSMEDIDNIKWDTAKAVLPNDCELDLNILDGAVNRNIMLRLLKGATVTQQKGNNNTAFNLEAFKNQAYTAMTKNLDNDIAKFNEGK